MALGWKLSQNQLPVLLADHKMFTFGNRIFVMGGYTGSVDNFNIYSALVDGSGNLGPFSITGYFPAALAGAEYVGLAQNPGPTGTIYAVGGINSSGVSSNNVWIGTPNNAGAVNWTAGPQFPTPIGYAQATICNGWLYVLGGFPGNFNAVSTAGLTAVTGNIALALNGGNSVTITLSAGATWLATPAVGSIINIASGPLNVGNDGGYYLVIASSATTLTANKISNNSASSVQVVAPDTVVSATAVTATLNVGIGPGVAVTTNCWASQIQSTGNLGNWSAASSFTTYDYDNLGNQVFTGATNYLVFHTAVGSSSAIYVMGGLIVNPNSSQTGQTASNLIAKGVPNSGANIAWTIEKAGLTLGRQLAVTPISNNFGKLIVAGGYSGGNAQSSTTTQKIDELITNSNGGITAVASESLMPVGTWNHGAVICNGWLFICGGKNASGTRLGTVYQAQLQSNLSF
jgi:hypothetical protein